jgi:hypothetical protein
VKPGNNLIISAIKSKHSADLTARLGEVALDSLLTQGVLREIPMIGSAIGLFNAGNDIAAYFFARKISLFLNEVETISQEDRQRFFEEKCSEEGAEEVGEATLLLLEKADNVALAKYLGRAFALFIKGTISRPAFDIYAFTIRDLNPYLIKQLTQIYAHEGVSAFDVPAAIQLANYGLMDVTIRTTLTNSQNMQRGYETTAHGKQFYIHIIAPDVAD